MILVSEIGFIIKNTKWDALITFTKKMISFSYNFLVCYYNNTKYVLSAEWLLKWLPLS